MSVEETLLINRVHMENSPQLKKSQRGSRITAVIFLCMGVIFLLGVTFTPKKAGACAWGIGMMLAGVAVWTGFPFQILIRKAVIKAYAKRPDRDLPFVYTISQEGLKHQCDIASTDLDWRAFTRVVRSAQGFLLYFSETQVHWLPVRGFENPADVDRFAALAKEKITDYKDAR